MNRLEALGLIELTTQKQADNGTRCFHDPIAKCDYLSYESGYVRRAYKNESAWRWSNERTIYQLNKTRKGVWVSERTGKEYDCTERIMIPNATDRLERIAHCVVTYRNNKNK